MAKIFKQGDFDTLRPAEQRGRVHPGIEGAGAVAVGEGLWPELRAQWRALATSQQAGSQRREQIR